MELEIELARFVDEGAQGVVEEDEAWDWGFLRDTVEENGEEVEEGDDIDSEA